MEPASADRHATAGSAPPGAPGGWLARRPVRQIEPAQIAQFRAPQRMDTEFPLPRPNGGSVRARARQCLRDRVGERLHAELRTGHVHDYPVVAMLWGSATVKGHPGERRYTEATLSYTKGRPAVYVTSCNGKVVATYPVTQTLPLGA
jgi:hypothetical protein